jgi:hypothetical protein
MSALAFSKKLGPPFGSSCRYTASIGDVVVSASWYVRNTEQWASLSWKGGLFALEQAARLKTEPTTVARSRREYDDLRMRRGIR